MPLRCVIVSFRCQEVSQARGTDVGVNRNVSNLTWTSQKRTTSSIVAENISALITNYDTRPAANPRTRHSTRYTSNRSKVHVYDGTRRKIALIFFFFFN